MVLWGLLIASVVLASYLKESADRKLLAKINQPVQTVDSRKYWKNNDGKIIDFNGKSEFTSDKLTKLVPESNMARENFVLYWRTENGGNVVSTLGSDNKHHFVQGYLSNFMPFHTEKIWIPLYTIGMRKRYSHDETVYNGFLEVWQYSIEAYTNSRGDCEDHSIILCDWLNALGYDARVVAGKHKDIGHAWVVLYQEGRSFILEATQKSNLKNNSHYPLASILPEYRPQFMFDGEYYYEPKEVGELSHDKTKWKKASKYIRNSAS